MGNTAPIDRTRPHYRGGTYTSCLPFGFSRSERSGCRYVSKVLPNPQLGTRDDQVVHRKFSKGRQCGKLTYGTAVELVWEKPVEIKLGAVG